MISEKEYTFLLSVMSLNTIAFSIKDKAICSIWG